MNLRRTNIIKHNGYLDCYNLNLNDEYFVRRGIMYSKYYCNKEIKNKTIIKKYKHLFDIIAKDSKPLSEMVKVKIFKPIIAGTYEINNFKNDMVVIQTLDTNGLAFVQFKDILKIINK